MWTWCWVMSRNEFCSFWSIAFNTGWTAVFSNYIFCFITNYSAFLFYTCRIFRDICQKNLLTILLLVLAAIVMWSGKKLVIHVNWTESTFLDREIDGLDGLMKQCSSERKVGILWTGMKAVTHWATCMTEFLPRRITTSARTGRRIVNNFSDKDLR